MKIKTDRISGISAFITPKMREHAVPGMAAALISGGEIIHTETAGCADPDKGIRITEDTHFEAASLTKPVFGRLVLKLASEGKLSLDSPISEWYTSPVAFSDDPRFCEVTARHVLSHSTGLPNWGECPLPLKFRPGFGFGYSGKGYTYLQNAVESIVGTRLDDILQREIFDLLDMDGAAMIWTSPLNRTLSRTFDENGTIEPLRSSCRHSVALEPNAAFSLYVTIRDYPKFILSVLSDREYTDMVKSTKNPAEAGVYWGLGWGLYKELIWHWGDNGGFKSLVMFDPDTQDGLLIHTNGFNGLRVCYALMSYLTDYDLDDISLMISNAE